MERRTKDMLRRCAVHANADVKRVDRIASERDFIAATVCTVIERLALVGSFVESKRRTNRRRQPGLFDSIVDSSLVMMTPLSDILGKCAC